MSEFTRVGADLAKRVIQVHAVDAAGTQFNNGAQLGAWLGLTPKQNSSGGKNNLGGITKRGDMVLRMLLIQSAKLAVMSAHKSANKRDDPISQWVVKLKEESGWQKAGVALANKYARILWAVQTQRRGL